MNDYELGVKLRRQILSDLARGLPNDGRRLQALVGDLCGHEQLSLLPALKYLVMTPGFNSAAAQRPPLPADARLLLRLQQELNEVFAAAISARMDAVLRGLMGVAPATTQGVALEPIPEPEDKPEDEDNVDQEIDPPDLMPHRDGSRGLVAVLSFIAGVLVVGVGGGLAWLLLQREPDRFPELSDLNGIPARQQPTPQAIEPPPAPDLERIANETRSAAQAIASVEQLYNELSLGNIQAARQRFGGEAADQFDPAFFRQFQRVSVDNLREISRDGSLVTLEGLVTFVYPDGTSQSESRSFTVETATEPALITGSNFGQVTRSRQ